MIEEKHPLQQMLVPLSLSVIVLIRLRGLTVADPDLWGYMTFGRLFWDSRTFPYQDIFTYLPNTMMDIPRVAHMLFIHWVHRRSIVV
jgi:hypothetical protein